MTLTVLDPAYRTRVLTVHRELDATTAMELAAIYEALGYPPTSISVTTEFGAEKEPTRI